MSMRRDAFSERLRVISVRADAIPSTDTGCCRRATAPPSGTDAFLGIGCDAVRCRSCKCLPWRPLADGTRNLGSCNPSVASQCFVSVRACLRLGSGIGPSRSYRGRRRSACRRPVCAFERVSLFCHGNPLPVVGPAAKRSLPSSPPSAVALRCTLASRRRRPWCGPRRKPIPPISPPPPTATCTASTPRAWFSSSRDRARPSQVLWSCRTRRQRPRLGREGLRGLNGVGTEPSAHVQLGSELSDALLGQKMWARMPCFWRTRTADARGREHWIVQGGRLWQRR